MTQYYTDFSEYTTDQQPSDWTARWVTSGVTYTVVTFSGATGGKALRMVISVDGNHGFTWNDIDGDANRANIEILTRVRADTLDSFTALSRGSGAAAAENGYFGGLRHAGGNTSNEIQRALNGAFSSLLTDSDTWAIDTWYWVRFRVNGTAIKVRRWAGAFGDEPGTWDLEATNGDVSAAGWAGIYAYSAEGGPSLYFDLFSVATNGETALGPMTASVSGLVDGGMLKSLTRGGLVG